MSAFRLRTRAAAALALGLGASLALPAIAAQFALSNTRIHLDPARATETVVLTNQEARAVTFEVHAKRWTQTADGEWQLAPTQDLVVHPLILRMPAEGEARLRVGTLSPTVTTEQTYRLELQELPDGSKAKAGEVRLLTTTSLPVFVQVPGAESKLALAVKSVDASGLSMWLSNSGTAYAAPNEAKLRVLDKNGKTVHDSLLSTGYVLSGSRIPVRATLPAAACARAAKIELTFERTAPLVASVDPGSRKCAP
ncbi:P pilus assembly protein chaperone PapD-like protein [Lysobacter dokdonensis DS-58]|uniref:P pilus assembly protein chaperone PapD-like protein n=1 Tax=Lysobacter dokdonensis DS-58 TaxID=1300345 RepID=A0A0A2WGL9_9GAMM|nr:fimbria/pilus periplasmic chaperone [Lysobacter dokdonensis]KGQ19331.1 P pilus assembly protein chaperone PapD-like protein [Lysobacter dokdonensis DS-58]